MDNSENMYTFRLNRNKNCILQTSDIYMNNSLNFSEYETIFNIKSNAIRKLNAIEVISSPLRNILKSCNFLFSSLPYLFYLDVSNLNTSE